MAQNIICYEQLVQDALRDVIRKVLENVEKGGLPGEHHFFITFSTHLSGVQMSSNLRERYPHKMTIVLQHKFWDLSVEKQHFRVTLSFGDIPEKLTIPFSAIQGFYDPIASFEASFKKHKHVEYHKQMERIKESPELKVIQKAKENESSNSNKTPADIVLLDAFRKK
ncbi:MAG: hypothetical protein JSC161_000201 [Candidatus Tokpelaia sp. JSC161]|jgi:hypothetical protein|nr:MAG: hypothetical protein JSC161_000201 [Candidatus Tokpelaia sp. JSC161]